MIEKHVKKRIVVASAAAILAFCLLGSTANAGPKFPPSKLGFSGGGGSFTYSPGNPLNIDGMISQVVELPNYFDGKVAITGGAVDITTGSCTVGCSQANGNDVLQMQFGNGTIKIVGGIPSMGISNGTTLLSGTLTDIGATLDGPNYHGTGGPDKGGITATILVNMINATLLTDLGFAADDTFGTGNKQHNAGTGVTFSILLGINDFGYFFNHNLPITGDVTQSLITVDPEPAPEPTTLLLFGSSFMVGAWMLRRKFAIKS
jgi:hypothetical protein